MVISLNSSFWHGRFIRYVPLVLCVGLILFMSTTSASMSNTSRFVRPLLEFLFPNSPESTLVIYHGYIRKFGHFAEYGVLALIASRAFFNSSKAYLKRTWYLNAFAVVLFVASLDELNQSFNPTRTGSMFDVLIDCSGGLAAIVLYYIFVKIWFKTSPSF